jgi:predicted phage terminase large subunit-like protein
VGVGGGSTGKGFSFGGIDDPVKDDQDAQSEVIRQRTVDWYESVWSTRLAPDAAQIITMTRWHESDLVGYLLAKEDSESPECWHVVNMQAVYDPANMIELPKSCTLEPDWREPGEALCPERYPLSVLRAIEAKTPRVFASLYQQYPRPRDGSLFKWAHFADRFLDAIPAGMHWLAYWDTAGTEGAGDHTAGALVGYNSKSGRFHIAEVVRGQWGPSRKDLEIRATCERWRSLVGLSSVWLETEAGIGGKDRTKATIAALVGFRVQTEHPTGSKVVRAEVWAAQQEAGNVTMSRGDWNHGFIERSTAFPFSNVDDEQDAVSGAFAKIGTMARVSVYVAPEDQAEYERTLAQMRQSA